MATSHRFGRGPLGPVAAAGLGGLALLATLTASCTIRRERMLVGEIAQAVQTSPAHIELPRFYPAPWDRVCVITPHTDAGAARALLGFDYRRADALARRDDVSGLWFIRGQKVIAAVDFPRRQGDFAAAGHPYCLPRAQAVFRAELNPGGGARVLPADTAALANPAPGAPAAPAP